MPGAQLGNPAGLFGLTGSTNSQEIESYVNASASAVNVGDVVIWETTAAADIGLKVNTTTGGATYLVAGVVGDGGTTNAASAGTYASGAYVPVVRKGIARVKVTGLTAVVAGDLLTAGASAGVPARIAAGTGPAATEIGKVIAVALQAYAARDANNCILCIIGRI